MESYTLMNNVKIETQDPNSTDQVAIAAIIRRRVRAGLEQQFIAWSKDIEGVAKTFPGYVHTRMIQLTDSPREFVTLVTFDEYGHFKSWEKSEELASRLRQLPDIIERETSEQIVGLGHWLDLKKGNKKAWPPNWRMVFVAFLAIWPLVYFLSPILRPFLPNNPLVASMLSTAVITAAMGYGTLPLMWRVFRKWLSNNVD